MSTAVKNTNPTSGERAPVTVPLAAERIAVRKRAVKTATVRLRRIVRDRTVNIDEPLLHHDVVVERRPVDRFVDVEAKPRREGDVLVIPVMEEVLVTRLRVIEEIRIQIRRSVRRERRTVRLRREDVEIERRSGASTRVRRRPTHTEGGRDGKDSGRNIR